ncbi:hypothetical protein HLB23_20055 [Nocardia uniformis]|uniref:Uncharacterized protein n=1 Tax=Nocardia uniformis TaxID=53432 RepID=A0A849C0I9_9NOCA|nr:hypothetical protein [Nocardia uniformis]
MRRIGIGTAAVVLVAVILVLGWAIPPVPAVIGTDRLGPSSGEAIAVYLDRARESLRGNDSDPHWALISFTAGIAADRIPEYADGLRISGVDYHVDISSVVTPMIAVPVAAGDAAALRSAELAAGVLDQQALTAGPDSRAGRIAAVAAARLRADCACVVGLTVFGTLDELRNLAAHPDIRAVEALPADASGGTFAVVPLLPQWQEFAVPGPDDGVVPEN